MFTCLALVRLVIINLVAAQNLATDDVNLLTLKDTDVDVLCASRDTDNLLFLPGIGTVFKATFWCDSWSVYSKHLSESATYNRNMVTLIPRSVWNGSLWWLLVSYESDCPLSSWLIVSKEERPSGTERHVLPSLHFDNVATNETRPDVALSWIRKCVASSYVNLTSASTMEEQRAPATITSLLHQNRSLVLGCLGSDCTMWKLNIIIECFNTLGVKYTTTMTTKQWMRDIIERKIDIMVDKIVYTEKRFKHLYFPGVLYYGKTVFYTARRPSRYADEILREASLTFFALLLLSMIACLLCFCLINYSCGRNLFNDIQDVASVLVSTALLFAYPVPKRFRRFVAGRIVLFCWMAGGFSLAVYFHSLLTSSLSTGYGWDADDTIEKLYPKLASGKLLPCVQKYTYIDSLLRQSDGKQNIMGAMAAAWRRSHGKDYTLSDTGRECINKVVRGSHVFLSYDIGECAQAMYGSAVIVGKETIHMFYASTPIRKDFPLRDSYGKLVKRIFETGWELRVVNMELWNCSRFVDREVHLVPYDATQFLSIYYMCCGAAAVALALEILFSRVF